MPNQPADPVPTRTIHGPARRGAPHIGLCPSNQPPGAVSSSDSSGGGRIDNGGRALMIANKPTGVRPSRGDGAGRAGAVYLAVTVAHQPTDTLAPERVRCRGRLGDHTAGLDFPDNDADLITAIDRS